MQTIEFRHFAMLVFCLFDYVLFDRYKKLPLLLERC